MSNPERLATLIRDVLNDRLTNGTKEHLALETATLRGYIFATLETIDHITQHIEHDEITSKEQTLEALHYLTTALENRMANLEDVRTEILGAHRRNNP